MMNVKKKGKDEMSKAISLKGLPNHMVRRLIQKEISESELAYAGIGTVLLVPMEDGGTMVVFDLKSEWNYIADANVEELFSCMAGRS